jgi:ubiquinone/menaquinone biosynthesis C-methylase UbiE
MTSIAKRPTLAQRFFAWTLARYGDRYEAEASEIKQRLLASAQGTVVEIGPGTGANFRYLPMGIQWIGIEPNSAMHEHLRAEAARHGYQADVSPSSADRMEIADASVDSVIGTWVLCSVEDQSRVLAEVVRILKPGGRFLFFEHVAAPPGTWQRFVQRLARPFSVCFCGRCRPDRSTDQSISAAGFSSVSMECVKLPVGLSSPHIVGIATK